MTMMTMMMSKKTTTTRNGDDGLPPMDDSMEQLKERARAARKKFVLSEKAIQSGGDRSTKFGYCLMYVNAIQKSVNGLLDFGKGSRSDDCNIRDIGEKKRSPRDAAFELGEEDEEKKRRTKKKRKEHEEREEKEPQKEKEDATKTLLVPRTVKKSQTTKSEILSPTTTGETKKKTTTNATTIEENDEATNTKATKKIINPGRYPGEYCQYCGEHEHMVHVKYASQVLGEGKLVCYGCLAEEKKELERKQKVMTNAKKREKNRQAKMKMKAAMLSTPTTTVTSMSNLPSLPLSSPPSMIESPAVPNDAITAPQQQPSPVSVAVVVDGETARVNTVIHNIATPIATTEHIEAIHDVVCDLCGKNTFRTAAELKVHKMKWCIAKNSAVMASTLPIERKAKPTISSPSPTPSPTFENEDAQDSGKGKSSVTKPRILPIAEVLHKAKYGFPVTKIASSSNLSFHVAINDSIDDNNNNAAALALPRELNKEAIHHVMTHLRGG